MENKKVRESKTSKREPTRALRFQGTFSYVFPLSFRALVRRVIWNFNEPRGLSQFLPVFSIGEGDFFFFATRILHRPRGTEKRVLEYLLLKNLARTALFVQLYMRRFTSTLQAWHKIVLFSAHVQINLEKLITSS